MKKKKLLFMTHAMPIGGTESALLAMLYKIDYDTYDVDLLLAAKEGERLRDIPPNVRVMALDQRERIFFERLNHCINQLKQGRYAGWCMIRICHSIVLKVYTVFGKQFDIWQLNSRFIKPLPGVYHAAIDYDGFCNPYILDKVNAKKKLMWNHFDYKFFQKNISVNRKYFARMDKILSVSQNGADTLQSFFPELKDKITVFHNFLDEVQIARLSKVKVTDLPGTEGVIRICSIGRLQEQKDFGLAVRAAKVLKDRNVQFIWYVVGDGPDKKVLHKQIISGGLSDVFILLGKRSNPYPYLNACDIYCQTSVFEGLCIALTEARFLRKPMVVTNVQGLRELVENGKTGYIVPRNERKIADAIQSMNADVRKRFTENLEKSKTRQGKGMDYFYKLINE